MKCFKQILVKQQRQKSQSRRNFRGTGECHQRALGGRLGNSGVGSPRDANANKINYFVIIYGNDGNARVISRLGVKQATPDWGDVPGRRCRSIKSGGSPLITLLQISREINGQVGYADTAMGLHLIKHKRKKKKPSHF